ncbi:MAG: serine--tRNA ligase [bacterium]|nr:serine--tRNA ligase [bacterium]
MIDLKLIREHPEALDHSLTRRGGEPASQKILALDVTHRGLVQKVQDLQSRRNQVAKEIGFAKSKGEETADLAAEAGKIKKELPALEEENRRISEELQGLLATLPNILAEDVPEGLAEEDAVELRQWGTPPPIENPKHHFEIGEALGHMDFETATKMSGSRFVVLSGPLARLERALAAFMLDIHTKEFDCLEVSPPLLVRSQAVFGTGQLPKFSEDLFQTTDGRWLIPTAEVSLTNLVREQILEEVELPLRFCAYTPCFRSEAGSAGRDTRGMIRQHQFSKVEMVSVTHPDHSAAEHERMTKAAETVLQRLELAYRVMALSAGDTSGTAQKTYDLEVWLPGSGCYREISSCSVVGDYQARRMKTRFRETGASKGGTHYVHTLNGSGVAVGRALVAVLENYQQADGTVRIPEALRPYMDGVERLELPSGCKA